VNGTAQDVTRSKLFAVCRQDENEQTKRKQDVPFYICSSMQVALLTSSPYPPSFALYNNWPAAINAPHPIDQIRRRIGRCPSLSLCFAVLVCPDLSCPVLAYSDGDDSSVVSLIMSLTQRGVRRLQLSNEWGLEPAPACMHARADVHRYRIVALSQPGTYHTTT
jgi:hypothetical protein